MPLVASEPVLRPVSVVLLHGFMGDRRDLEPLRRALAPSFGCITLDLPGHGDTAHLTDKAEESSEGLLDGLVAALEGLHRPSGVALVGYSLGARLALQVAVLRPDLVTAVVALGGNPGLLDGASREARLARDRDLASRLREMDPTAFASWLREEWYRAGLWGDLADHPLFDGMLSRRVDGAIPNALADALEQSSVGLQPSLWGWLEAPTVPVLYAAGELDATYSGIARQLAAASSPESWLQVSLLPRAAHAVLLQASNAVEERCVEFLKGNLLPTPTAPTLCTRFQRSLRVRGWRMHRFSLPLRAPLNLACGEPLQSRDGLFLLLLADADGAGAGGQLLGIGECCPLPGFHAESLTAAEAQLLSAAAALCGRTLPRSVASLGGALEAWLDMPALLPSVRCALEMALLQLLARACECSLPELLAHSTPSRAVQTHVRMNGLLVRGEQLSKAEGEATGTQPMTGPRTLKMKVGGADGNAAGVQVAQAWRLCSARGQRLRLDANQGWTLVQAEACMRVLQEAGVSCEYVEEPLCAADVRELPALFLRCGVPYALDESVLAVDDELLRTLLADEGCVGLVLKPTLLGGIEKTMTLAALAEEHGKLAVLTSAFESGVAHSFLSLVAAALPGASVAHGLSTFERLERDAFQPPFADLVRTDLIDVRAASLYLAATTTQCDPSTAFAQSGGL